MRLFVALWPPSRVLDEVAVAVGPLKGSTAGLRWTTREQWHLTLAFLGEVDDVARAALEPRLARAAARHGPLAVCFAGAGRFGDRVLYLKVAGQREETRRLAASVAAAARRAGIDVDGGSARPFRAHLTLARGADRSAPQVSLAPLVASLEPFEGSAWSAGALSLVRSRLGQGAGQRATYETVAAWPLGRP